MSYFDRFDICEAYTLLESLYNVGGVLRELPSNGRLGKSVASRMSAVNFSSGRDLSFDSLSENGRDIYFDAVCKLDLPIEREDAVMFSSYLGHETMRGGLHSTIERARKGHPIDGSRVDLLSGLPKGTWDAVSSTLCSENGLSKEELLSKLVEWGSLEPASWSKEAEERFRELVDAIQDSDFEKAIGLVPSVPDVDMVLPTPCMGMDSTGFDFFPVLSGERGVLLRLAMMSETPELLAELLSRSEKSDDAEYLKYATRHDVPTEMVLLIAAKLDDEREGRDMESIVMDAVASLDPFGANSVETGIALVRKFEITNFSCLGDLAERIRSENEKRMLVSDYAMGECRTGKVSL